MDLENSLAQGVRVGVYSKSPRPGWKDLGQWECPAHGRVELQEFLSFLSQPFHISMS